MQLEKIAKDVKNVGRKFLILPALIGAFYLGGCKNTITGDITVKKENAGEIVGKVLYPFENGYSGVEGAIIWRKGSDNPLSPLGERTESITGGVFSYQDVPVGSHELTATYIKKTPRKTIGGKGEIGVSVTKGSVVNVEILLRKIGY